ncbi:MAG: outer membrane protein assembly factor BamD [Candidatus Marinimicrobia bacterium]|nr:outer membrane protein assembly factor BamD [Candidatus Neomarinimicrobiota bacterium]MCF7839196.1 outer membrane protein assembly factor BamD [Candidatus Neomarinimicrobiota bacterium]MCF7902377.1 outer membrane protein assembly factor BamD [Candidatus Neomarinimicrobiota bacterium]
MVKWIKLTVLSLLTLWIFQGCAGSKPQFDVNNIEQEYEKGLELMEKKNWLRAEETFTFIVYNDPVGVYADDAQFQLAETHYFREEYLIAIDEYNRLINRMPNSPFVEQASWRKAESYYLLSPDYRLDQTLTKRALKEMQNFIDLFPQSEHVPRATEHIVEIREKLAHKLYGSGILYLKLREWDSALLYFNEILDLYYDTTYREAALVAKAEALVGKNELDEAEQIMRQVNPEDLEKSSRKQLTRAYEELQERRAEASD